MKKDTYLEGLYTTLEMCDLVLDNKSKFPVEQIEKAENLKLETENFIKLRESIPIEQRL